MQERKQKGEHMQGKYSIIVGALLLLVSVAKAETASINLNDSLSCTVTRSNDKNVKVGSLALKKITLRSLAQTGFIKFQPMGSIDFYGPLVIYEVEAPGSGAFALANNPSEPREIQGSIFVSQSSDKKVVLEIQLFQLARVFEIDSGTQALITKDAPSVYQLSCQP